MSRRARSYVPALCLSCLSCLACRATPPVTLVLAPPAAPIASASTSSAARAASPRFVALAGYARVGRLAVLGGVVYFIGYEPGIGIVAKVRVQGGEMKELHAGREDPDTIVPTPSGVYYHNQITDELFRVSLGGGPPTLVGDADEPSLGGDGTKAVWSHGGDLYTTTGTRPEKLASGVGEVQAVAVDAEAVYWASYARRAIERLRLAHRQPEPLAKVGSDGGIVPAVLALDATHVYYLDVGEVKRVAKTGGEPEVLLAGHHELLGGLAVDGTDER